MSQPTPDYPQFQPGPPLKKPWYKRIGCLIGIAIVVIFFAMAASCIALVGGVANEVDKSSKAEYAITYKITGDAKAATVTFTTGSTDTTQETHVAAPWEKQVTLKGFSMASLMAGNGMYDEGKITCQIVYNGKAISENTASGAGASASCSVSSSDLK